MKINSLIFLLMFSLYSQHVVANKNWEIQLTTKNHIGYLNKKSISFKDKKLIFSGIQIDKLLYPSALQNIKEIKNHNAKKNYCHKGEYFLKINNAVSSGCLESESYTILNENFDKLKYLALLSSN